MPETYSASSTGGKGSERIQLPESGFGTIHGPIMSDSPQPSLPAGSPPTLTPDEVRARSWNMWCHLSALAGYLGVPFGSVLGPLLVWQFKKHEVPSVAAHGKAALNFQLTVFLATLVMAIAGFILAIFCIGYLLLVFVALIPLAGLFFTVIAGVKANDGMDYQYPFSLKLIT
jgi:uncharacterized Tic20 family protein